MLWLPSFIPIFFEKIIKNQRGRLSDTILSFKCNVFDHNLDSAKKQVFCNFDSKHHRVCLYLKISKRITLINIKITCTVLKNYYKKQQSFFDPIIGGRVGKRSSKMAPIFEIYHQYEGEGI